MSEKIKGYGDRFHGNIIQRGQFRVPKVQLRRYRNHRNKIILCILKNEKNEKKMKKNEKKLRKKIHNIPELRTQPTPLKQLFLTTILFLLVSGHREGHELSLQIDLLHLLHDMLDHFLGLLIECGSFFSLLSLALQRPLGT